MKYEMLAFITLSRLLVLTELYFKKALTDARTGRIYQGATPLVGKASS
jgi:hypothetical protein